MAECKSYASLHPKKSVSQEFVPSQSRNVTQSQREQVKKQLTIYHKNLLTKLLNTVSYDNVNSLANVSFLLGFSEVQVENIEYLFTATDVSHYVDIWNPKHSHKILQIVSSVFADVEETLTIESNVDDLLQDRWEAFLEDDELLNMAADRLFNACDLLALPDDSVYENGITSELSTSAVSLKD